MTREEQIRILTDAQERAFKQIDLTDGCEMGSEEFSRLVSVANQLSWEIRDPVFPSEVEVAGVPEQVQPEPAKPETAPEEVQPETQTGVDEPKFTMVEVRAALAKARAKGVNVSEIVRSFGVESFPEIPESQYGAVMAKLEGVFNAT
jgi:hypothetical protein